MPENICPVSNLIGNLETAVDSGRLTNPRDRRRAEDILRLLRDVAWGGADAEHIALVVVLAQDLRGFENAFAPQIGGILQHDPRGCDFDQRGFFSLATHDEGVKAAAF